MIKALYGWLFFFTVVWAVFLTVVPSVNELKTSDRLASQSRCVRPCRCEILVAPQSGTPFVSRVATLTYENVISIILFHQTRASSTPQPSIHTNARNENGQFHA